MGYFSRCGREKIGRERIRNQDKGKERERRDIAKLYMKTLSSAVFIFCLYTLYYVHMFLLVYIYLSKKHNYIILTGKGDI